MSKNTLKHLNAKSMTGAHSVIDLMRADLPIRSFFQIRSRADYPSSTSNIQAAATRVGVIVRQERLYSFSADGEPMYLLCVTVANDQNEMAAFLAQYETYQELS